MHADHGQVIIALWYLLDTEARPPLQLWLSPPLLKLKHSLKMWVGGWVQTKSEDLDKKRDWFQWKINLTCFSILAICKTCLLGKLRNLTSVIMV